MARPCRKAWVRTWPRGGTRPVRRYALRSARRTGCDDVNGAYGGRTQTNTWREFPLRALHSQVTMASPTSTGVGTRSNCRPLPRTNNLARAPVDVVESYLDHFLRPQTQTDHQQEHRVIAQIDRVIAADGFEQLVNDTGLEMARRPVRSPAARCGYGIGQVARGSPAPEEEPQDVAHIGKTPTGPSSVTIQEGEDGFGRDGGQILRRAGGGAAEPNDAPHHIAVDRQPIPEHSLVVPEPVVQFRRRAVPGNRVAAVLASSG